MSLAPKFHHDTLILTDEDTGEIHDIDTLLDADPALLADAYAAANRAATQIQSLRTRLQDLIEIAHDHGLIESGDRYGARQLVRDRKRVWDEKRVPLALDRLVASGTIPEARAAALVETVEKAKPNGRKLNSLLEELAGKDPAAADDLASTKRDIVRWAVKEAPAGAVR